MKIAERISLINSVVDLAFDENGYDFQLLEVAKVVYISLSKYEEDGIIDICPKDEEGNVDFLATYEQLTEEGVWDEIKADESTISLIKDIDKRYEERKEIFLAKNSISGLIDELKEKFLTTMDSINPEQIQKMAENVPEMLNSLTDENKQLVDKVVTIDKKNKSKANFRQFLNSKK